MLRYWTGLLASITLATVGHISPVQARTAIAALPDGEYRFCQNVTSAASDLSGCFQFRKINNSVTGSFYRANAADPGICLTGQVQENTITGEALETLNQGNFPGSQDAGQGIDPQIDPLTLERGELVNPSFSATTGSTASSIYWRSAALVLDTFVQTDLGLVAIPQTCQPTQPEQLPQPFTPVYPPINPIQFPLL